MKSQFLAVYDYDTGGIWCLITARSAVEITGRYPQLACVERPDWMTPDIYARIEETMSFDIDRPTGWLTQLRETEP